MDFTGVSYDQTYKYFQWTTVTTFLAVSLNLCLNHSEGSLYWSVTFLNVQKHLFRKILVKFYVELLIFIYRGPIYPPFDRFTINLPINTKPNIKGYSRSLRPSLSPRRVCSILLHFNTLDSLTQVLSFSQDHFDNCRGKV